MKNKIFKPSIEFSKNSKIKSIDDYKKIYKNSILNKENFWNEKAKRIEWIQKWDKTYNYDFTNGNIKWFENGKLNVSYNCLDRHVNSGNGKKIAIIWEGNNPNEQKTFTYSELLKEVKKFSNVLKNNGIRKGDRICLYLQMIPELPISMLACARIGAIHSVVFGAFSSDSLRDRINDSNCKMLITQDFGVRGNKENIPMKENADVALNKTKSIESVIVVKRTGSNVSMLSPRDKWWKKEMNLVSSHCPIETID